MKNYLILFFFLLLSFQLISQNVQTVIVQNKEGDLNKAHIFIYTSPIGIEYFNNAEPFLSWVSNQQQSTYNGQAKFGRATLLTFDYFQHNRIFVGASLFDRALGMSVHGGPNFGLNSNFHAGVRILRKKVILDLFCCLESTDWKFRFDSPPPFSENECNFFLSEHSFNEKNAVYFELLKKQFCFEPAIRFAYQFNDKQELGIKIGYRYVFEDGSWNFYAVQPTGGLFPKYYNVNPSIPDELKQKSLTNGFYFQIIWGINFVSPEKKHFDWNEGRRVANEK